MWGRHRVELVLKLAKTLLNWLISKFNTQADQGPLENLSQILKDSKYPKQLCVSIGATRYTPFGESTFLVPGDIACVALYNPNEYTTTTIERHLMTSDTPLSGACLLKQHVTYTAPTL